MHSQNRQASETPLKLNALRQPTETVNFMDRLDWREPTVIGGSTCVTPVLQVCINANPCNPFRYSKLHLKCHTHTKPTTISHVSVTKPTPVQVALTHGRPHSDPRHITLPTRLCMEPTPSTLHGPAAHHTASTLPSTPLQFTATTLQSKGEATILECSSFASSCSRGRVPRPRKR